MEAVKTECVDCNYLFEKPQMHKITVQEKIRSTEFAPKIGSHREESEKGLNPSFRVYSKDITQWVCGDCYKKRSIVEQANRVRNRQIILWALVISAIAIFVLVIASQ